MDVSSAVSFLPGALAVAGFASALVSAWFWYRSSKVEAVPTWLKFGQIEPVDPVQAQIGWTVGVLEAARESATLNRKGALWTAAATVLGASAAFTALIAP